MKKTLSLIAALSVAFGANAQTHKFTVDTSKPGASIQPTMYGVFFEDINYAADGGVYAEMIENRSFETPQQFQGWDLMGRVELSRVSPAFDRNPHYASLMWSGHDAKATGMVNRGYFGIGLKKGMSYDFSVYARAHGNAPSRIKVQILDKYSNVLSESVITVAAGSWHRYTASLASDRTDGSGMLRILLMGRNGVDLDHVSMFPSDNWNGLRADLVQALADLHPGVFRFPGGCIVEGTDLATRYQWKNTVGPAENRPLNENRWNNTYDAKFAPSYYQSGGLGFYEYFLLSEKIGAAPVPIVSVGLACQFQNNSVEAHVPVEDLGPYVQDALDLIEFANGPVTSRWGALRAEMGHPAPFNMKYLGVGNEQWDSLYPERLEVFVKALRAEHPEIELVGSAGPYPSGKDYDYLWKEMERLGADLVDEHYYSSPEWFLQNARRYDSFDRSRPKVFAGEYAAHIDKNPDLAPSVKEHAPFHKNTFYAALCEAAFMTGLERNADVVQMSAYAPLFAHAQGWQWDPDLIWFDNLGAVRTANWHVQQMYACNSGTTVLPLTENGNTVAGEDSLYATACFDAASGNYIVKIVNAGESDRKVSVTFEGLKALGIVSVTTLHAADDAFNTLENPELVKPAASNVKAKGNTLGITVPGRSFQVYRF